MDSPSYDSDVPSHNTKKMKRGRTMMKEVARAKRTGRKLDLGWNRKGQPVDPNESKFKSYIGVVTRRTVPITYSKWKDVPDKIKDAIWDDIAASFNIDVSRRKFVLQAAAVCHRRFRSRLTNQNLRDDSGNINEQPPELHLGVISQEQWDAFAITRQEPSFQKASEKNRERASNPLYPYRKGRTAYAILEQQMVGSETSTVARHVLWKKGRENKEGCIDDERIKRIWDECEFLSQSVTQDEIENSGRYDILARVLQVPEVPGRVRGVGFGVCQRDYFGTQKHSRSQTNNEVAQLKGIVATLQQQLYEQSLRFQEYDEIFKNKKQTQVAQDSPSMKDSFTLASQLRQGKSKCQLWLVTPVHRVVARGSVYNNKDTVLHNLPLPNGHLRVQIEKAEEDGAELPLPVGNEVTKVGDAIGYFVAWPIGLIEPVETMATGGMVDGSENSMWPKHVVKCYIDIMLEEVTKGNMNKGVFSPRVWKSVLENLNAKSGRSFSLKQIKQKFNEMRAKHREFSLLLQQTGFCWDVETNTVTADEEAWRNYILAHPEVAPYKKQGLEHYQLLGKIFNRSTGTGVVHGSSTKDAPNSPDKLCLENKHLNGRVHVGIDRDVGISPNITDRVTRSGKRIVELPDRKKRKECRSDQLGEAVQPLVKASNARVETSSPGATPFDYSIAKCVSVLNEIDNVSDEAYVKAMDKLTDVNWREIFMTMPLERKKAWLKYL